ncbi:hypothetical protein [Luteimonas sp. RC10]|uniref:hypothetical protein n=1 Tax=Luteimonas sp. RC10 TaxID=2587035 RepID=UPI00160CBAAC|nr:hypothetical protein [Luteimonas sp. RC10]
MRNSTPSSNPSGRSRPTSEPARLHWRPSRLLIAALGLITLAACGALLLSELPGLLAWLGIPCVLASGLHTILRAARQPPHRVVVQATGQVLLDGRLLEAPCLHWRGPIVRLSWREGRRTHRLLWWPDTLPAPQRRELRLAAAMRPLPRAPESVAP